MSTPRPSRRPSFELRSKLPPEELARRLREHLKTTSSIRGLALKERIELSIAGDDLRFWSPQLVAEMTPDEDGGALVHGRFGPDPYVWALYLLSYGALSVLALLALCFGIAQWSIGQTPTALYATLVLAVLAGLVFGVSFIGQGLGAEQMYLLRSTLASIAEAELARANTTKGAQELHVQDVGS